MDRKDCAFEITSQAYLCDEFRPVTRQKVKENRSNEEQKAAGPNGIFSKYLNQSQHVLLKIGTHLFNECLKIV
jgi:hypothetical protein